MTDRCIDGFFYGLFMDRDVLAQSRIVPVRPRRAYIDEYALRIGQRATLVPASAGRVYGMLFALTHADLDALYGAPGLEQYRPEAVLAHLMEGGTTPALCYNLPKPPGSTEADAEYAARLRAVLSRLHFPVDYIASIS